MYCVLLFLSLPSMLSCHLFFFNPKTAYEMRISDWSSDVCSSVLAGLLELGQHAIDRGQPYFDFLADECTVNVFRALMAMVRLAKHIEDLQAWKCSLETHCFQLVLFVHS